MTSERERLHNLFPDLDFDPTELRNKYRREREPLDLEVDAVIASGTWYWNRYPGAQCDIESYCYLPLLEETGVMPKEKYSFAPEIFEHTQRIGKHFGLYENSIIQTRVTEVKWNEVDRRWQVSTHRNDNIRTQFVIHATGPANRPKLPGINAFNAVLQQWREDGKLEGMDLS